MQSTRIEHISRFEVGTNLNWLTDGYSQFNTGPYNMEVQRRLVEGIQTNSGSLVDSRKCPSVIKFVSIY